MKKIALVFLSFVMHCSFAQTQADMNKEAYAQYQKADRELNAVYRKILADYKSAPHFINNLKASQRIWITFRDAELNMKYPAEDAGKYGSAHSICQANYLEELTRAREQNSCASGWQALKKETFVQALSK